MMNLSGNTILYGFRPTSHEVNKRLGRTSSILAALAALLLLCTGTSPAACGLDQRQETGEAKLRPRESYSPCLLSSKGTGYPLIISKNTPRPRALSLEDILITGNIHLGDTFILSNMQLAPGDTVNVEILERERLRLLSAHRLITAVNLSTRPGSKRGTVILLVEVEEGKTFSFETGYGYHDVYGWFLTLLGVRIDQLYDSDSQLRLGLRFGFHIAGLDAEWKKPCPPNGGLGFGARFHVYSESHLFFGSGTGESPESSGEDEPYDWTGRGWREFRQKITRSGGDVSVRYIIGGTRLSFGMKAESVLPDSSFLDVEKDMTREFEDLPDPLKPDAGKTIITGLFLRIIRDSRDHFIYPLSGSFAHLSLEANNAALGSDEVFTKLIFDLRKHIHLGYGRVLSGRLNAGVISRGAPYYERFSIGGIYSIRGFQELSLSPTAGDDGFWIAGVELRLPLIASGGEFPRFSGLVFFDAGQGWQRGQAFSAANVQSAAGYGVRLQLPWLGTLGIDVGIPFSEGRTGENFQVHGSLGFSF